jgi:ElaB/YqjD/DUF883 family membrane-anchored ribosome-binding protein
MSETVTDTVSNTVADTVKATRARLEQTLDAIDEKLDVKKQAGEMKKQAGEMSERVKNSYESNPVPWIIGATAATVVVVGLVAWAIFGKD